MAKRTERQDVDQLMEGWIGVEKANDPIPWQAWMDWRRENLKCRIEPAAFTVPTLFPPVTVAAAREYIAIIQQVRASIGWKGGSAKLSTDVSAYMG